MLWSYLGSLSPPRGHTETGQAENSTRGSNLWCFWLQLGSHWELFGHLWWPKAASKAAKGASEGSQTSFKRESDLETLGAPSELPLAWEHDFGGSGGKENQSKIGPEAATSGKQIPGVSWEVLGSEFRIILRTCWIPESLRKRVRKQNEN